MRRAGRLLSRRLCSRGIYSWNNYQPIHDSHPSLFSSYSSSVAHTSISRVQQSTIIKSQADQSRQGESEKDCFSDESERECLSDTWSLDEECGRPDKFSHRDSCQDPCLVSHLIQVFSVSLHTPDFVDDDTPSQVYGSLHTTNSQGVISNLYTRTMTDHQTVPNTGGTLSLIGGNDNVITFAPSTTTIMDLHLSDRSRNTCIIQKNHHLHSIAEQIEDSSNKLIKDIVHGDRGFALIYYTKFLHAVSILVKVAILSTRDPTCLFLDVCGDIVAGYGNAREYCDNDDDVRHMKSTLFSRPFDHPQRIRAGRPMKLSRFNVSLPAYSSSLVIDANISDADGPLVCGSVEFHWPGHRKRFIDDEFGTIIVIVEKIRPSMKSYVDVDDNYVFETIVDDALTKESQVLSDQPEMVTSSRFGNTHSFSTLHQTSKNHVIEKDEEDEEGEEDEEDEEDEEGRGTYLVEVFSAYIGSTNHEVSGIIGNIAVQDCFKSEWNMFERDLDNPEIFSETRKGFVGFLPIERKCTIESDVQLTIRIHLKDPIANKEICNHDIRYFVGNTGYDVFDKRLYSVALGAHGYVVLHYIMFKCAYKATVEIMFLWDGPSAPVNICGCIFASNSNHNYSTTYEKKFYRSLLFSKPQPEIVQLDRHRRAPLSVSVVAVPEGAAIFIEVDLLATSTTNPQDVVFGKKEFKISFSKTRRAEILGKHCRVQITLNFKDVS